MSIGASGSVASTTSVSPGPRSAIRRFAIVSGSGHASPRASTVVTIAIVPTTPVLAAVLSTGEPERLYSGLSVLVSTAADGVPCAALVGFGALDLILDPDRARRVQEPAATPSLSWAGRDTFARSLDELIDAALGLESLTLHACAASVETMAIDKADVEERLDGVKSTPRFLRDAAEARLIFV
jgi:peroxiredoxin family protein